MLVYRINRLFDLARVLENASPDISRLLIRYADSHLPAAAAVAAGRGLAPRDLAPMPWGDRLLDALAYDVVAGVYSAEHSPATPLRNMVRCVSPVSLARLRGIKRGSPLKHVAAELKRDSRSVRLVLASAVLGYLMPDVGAHHRPLWASRVELFDHLVGASLAGAGMDHLAYLAAQALVVHSCERFDVLRSAVADSTPGGGQNYVVAVREALQRVRQSVSETAAPEDFARASAAAVKGRVARIIKQVSDRETAKLPQVNISWKTQQGYRFATDVFRGGRFDLGRLARDWPVPETDPHFGLHPLLEAMLRTGDRANSRRTSTEVSPEQHDAVKLACFLSSLGHRWMPDSYNRQIAMGPAAKAFAFSYELGSREFELLVCLGCMRLMNSVKDSADTPRLLKYAEKIRISVPCAPGRLPERFCEACWKKRGDDVRPLLPIPMVVRTKARGKVQWRSVSVNGRNLVVCPACCSLVDTARLRVTHPSLDNAWSCRVCSN